MELTDAHNKQADNIQYRKQVDAAFRVYFSSLEQA